MSVVRSVQEVGPCKKQFTLEIPAAEIAAETDQVVREYGRSARLPGFRKGKVPAAVVRRRFREDIEREVVDRLVPRAWERAQDEGGFDPLAPPRIEDVTLPGAGEPLTFVATAEVRPTIELESLGGLELPEATVEVGESELTEALDELRRQAADWIVAERSAARGDRVTAALVERSAGEDGETRESEPESIIVEVGDANLWEELTLALTGLAAGQEGRFSRRPATPEAPVRQFRVRVEKVEERDLPPLDDAFAAKVGPFADLPALRGKLRERLEGRKREARRREREQAALEQLRRRHPFGLPEGVVHHETEHLLRDYAEALARGGVDVEKTSIDWEALTREARPQAERRVHDRLLLDAVAEREGIEVSDGELDQAVAALARGQGVNPSLLRRRLDEEGRLAGLRRQLRRDRALARLLGETSEADGEAAAAG